MSAVLAAAAAACGVMLVLTQGRAGRGPGRFHPSSVATAARLQLDRAGLDAVTPAQFLAASLAAGTVAAAVTTSVFGPGIPAALVGVAACATPGVIWHRRRVARLRAARSAWPRMIEELRVLVGSAGRSIPQAFIEVGLAGPPETRAAFLAAQREWALSADFERVTTVLKRQLGDPTADIVCETLLVANQVGGDVDGRLEALAEDRRTDLHGRREAAAKQAGARLARLFVIVVPAGMAFAGLNVGEGRDAYTTGRGQLLVCGGLAVVALCWAWASRIMTLPEQGRVFGE